MPMCVSALALLPAQQVSATCTVLLLVSTCDPLLWLCQTPVNPKAPRTCSLFAGILVFNAGLGYQQLD
jgi:hypothetical protein